MADGAEARVTELEIKYMEQSDLLETLNGELVQANEQVYALTRRVQRLERQIEDLLRAVDLPANEKPPHY